MLNRDEDWSKDTRNLDALFILAAINALHGQYRAALKCIDRLEKADPLYPGLWGLKIKTYELMGDAETAARLRREWRDENK